jgi:hypothetical protein
VAGLLAALVPSLAMWGFTVDDALISIRYARHLADGVGWRFNAGGAATDGVTPLPWPLVLAPLARGGALLTLDRARVLGLLAWCTAGAALGSHAATRRAAPAWARGAALGVLALSVPVAAHATSGMETAVATSLATFAVLRGERPLLAATFAGVAAAFRPELAAWAVVLAVGVSLAGDVTVRRLFWAAGLALAPFAVCAGVRAAVWGRPTPLAVLARPSDLAHGASYAAAASVVVLTPILVLAPRALARSRIALAVVAAGAAHLLAVVAVGGDWMPLARLVVPIAPGLVWAAILASETAHPLATALRTAAAVFVGGFLLRLSAVADARHIVAEREALIDVAAPRLAGLRRVATLDIGWVSAATDADLVDLAGVTDPEVAALPGGHTSKHVDAGFLLSRDPDALLLYLANGPPPTDWRDAPYTRAVEARLADDEVIERHFAYAAWLPLGARGAGYVLLTAVPR